MDMLSWELLATSAGCATAVTALTQVIKQYVNIDPKWIALVLSLVITLGLQLFVNLDSAVNLGFSASSVILAVLNSFMVTGASIGLFEAAKHIGSSLIVKGGGR